MAKATVLETCIGCGACVGIAPEVFELNADGLAVATEGDLGANEAAAKEAAAACPVEAIVVE